MHVSVTFRHMPTSEPLKLHVEDKIVHLKKYLDDNAEAMVFLSVEHHRHKADINLNYRGMLIRGHETTEDMYSSIDQAVAKMETQVKKYKSRLADHRPHHSGARKKLQIQSLNSETFHENVNPNKMPQIAKTQEVDARPMMLDEAVMQMDLLDNDILVFLNVKTEHVNVLYRKKNNRYGLIETTAS